MINAVVRGGGFLSAPAERKKKKIPVNASLSTITFLYTTSGVQAGQSSRERTYFVMRET